MISRYLRKLRRHQSKRNQQHQQPERDDEASQVSPASRSSTGVLTSNVSHVFLDPDFDLTRPETFASIFPLSKEKSFPQQVETIGRQVQERLSHQLDEVEVSIARQVAHKSHNFFQVSVTWTS